MTDSRNRKKSGRSDQGGVPEIAEAIRELRVEMGLTQVQLAAEIGVTPTSIYRYEAGSIPTNETLVKILQFAVKSQSPRAVQQLTDVLNHRTGLTLVEGEPLGDESPFVQALNSLRREDQMLVMAAACMLTDQKDETAKRVFSSLVAPWIEVAKRRFGIDGSGSGKSIPAK